MDEPGSVEAYEGAPLEAFNIKPMTPREQEKQRQEDEEQFRPKPNPESVPVQAGVLGENEKDSGIKEAKAESVNSVLQNARQSRYVVGFMFDGYYQRVACIRKNKPAWQAGKLNGIGGKIESEETPVDAMRREFNEEAGFDCPEWRHYARLHGTNNDVGSFELHCFWSQTERLGFTSQEAEKIEIISVDHIGQRVDTIGNLPWLITMARDCALNQSPLRFADVVYGKESEADSVSNRLRSDTASSKQEPVAPLPRPLEQEQWTYIPASENQIEHIIIGKSLSRTIAYFEHSRTVNDLVGATFAHNTSLRALQEELVAAKQQLLNRELRWGEGEEFRKLAEKERDESRACLKLTLSVNGGFRLTAEEFERCQMAAGITGANRAGTMQRQKCLKPGDCVP